MDTTTCCVVGGGPAGAMVGLLLARAGVEVVVLEKHADFFRDFRGDTVHPSTVRLIDELGLGAEFARLPRSELTRMRMYAGDRMVVAADLTKIPGRYRHIAMVPQWDFLDLLTSAAGDEPTFTLRMRSTVTGVITEANAVGGVRYLDSDGVEHTLRADLVIACDGRDSVAREAAGLRQQMEDVPMDMWFLRIPKSADDHEGGAVQARFTSGNSAVAIDRGDYYQTGYIIEKGRDATLRATHDVTWLRERVGELFGWPTETLAAIRSWDDVKLLEVTVGMLDRWYVPGLLCIGDAAHTMSPVGGVGVNLAVQDAVAAARILARPLLDGTVRTADLEKVQRRRMLPASFTQRSQRGEHDMLIAPALRGQLETAPLPLRIVDAVPMLAGLTAYLGGMGLRPERAPDFARRPRSAPRHSTAVGPSPAAVGPVSRRRPVTRRRPVIRRRRPGHPPPSARHLPPSALSPAGVGPVTRRRRPCATPAPRCRSTQTYADRPRSPNSARSQDFPKPCAAVKFAAMTGPVRCACDSRRLCGMRIGTVVTAALVAVGVAMTTTGIGHAEPTPVHAQQAVDAPPSLRGIDKGLAYEVSATEDRRSVVTTLDAGRFELVHDGQVVTVTDRDGDVIAALPMVVRADEHAVPLAPEIDETGTRLTLTPIGESETPLRDISAQERFFAETQRLQPQIIEGAVIGAAIGFVLGFPLGLFVLDFITVPVATVAGAAIGALAGYALAGGQPAIDTALAYVTGAP